MTKISLRALRTNKNLTAKQAAGKVGVHHQTLLKYEKDSSKIPLELLLELANLYQVSLDDIFLGKKYELNQT